MLPLRSRDRALIEAANIAYHEAEASLYDASHPEIFWCERSKLWFIAERYLRDRTSPFIILDIGAGTGFVATVLKEFLKRDDIYIATDISPEMLGKLQEQLHEVAFQIRTIVTSADSIPMDGASCDLVVISSALHHFPDVDRCLREVARLLRPGGIFVCLHEPNILFAGSCFFKQVARAASVLAAYCDPSSRTAKPDYTLVFDHVNKKLIERGMVHVSLSPSEIQALVDVHSPTARGRYEAVGFDPQGWMRGPFLGWKIEELQTYNFLGKLDPSAIWWRRILESILSFLFSKHGSLFSLIIRKPF